MVISNVSGEVDGHIRLQQVSVDQNEVILLQTSWTRLILAVINVKCTILLARTEAKVEAKRKSAGDSDLEMQLLWANYNHLSNLKGNKLKQDSPNDRGHYMTPTQTRHY